MGIKGLNAWICKTFDGVMQHIPQESRGKGKGGDLPPVPKPYDHVLFDANGIVHQACRKRANEREVIRSIVFELDSLLRRYPPRVSVLIALDGPGPTAKLLEQRKRRINRVLKAARDAEAAIPGSAEWLRREELAKLEGRPPPSLKKPRKKGFDSLQVTPGTVFMLRLRLALEWYAASRLAGERGVLRPLDGTPPPLIFVSASNVPGEGELKLLQHLHAAQHWAFEAAEYGAQPGGHSRRSPGPQSSPSFLLVGPDADLLLLGLAAGVRNCDVLTSDAEGNNRLFKVAPLCDALVRQLSPSTTIGKEDHGLKANPISDVALFKVAETISPDGRVSFGNLFQLDFLVIAFLQGNDYLPKLRGANLGLMWRRLTELLRKEFAGQHLLRPTADGVEVNVRLLVTLAGASCFDVTGEEELGDDEEEEAEGANDEDDEIVEDAALKCETEMQDSHTSHSCSIDPNTWSKHVLGSATPGNGASEMEAGVAPTPCDDSRRKRAREYLPAYDVESYLNCLGWCGAMYLTGTCPDFNVAYGARFAPTAAQLAQWYLEREQGSMCGNPAKYLLPTSSLAGPPLSPDVFSLCLLPGAACEYIPRPLRPLMDASSPLADVFHANQVRPQDFVSRVSEAVGHIPKNIFSDEERAMIEAGSVTVWGVMSHGVRRQHGGKPHTSSLPHPFLVGRRLDPLRCLPPSPIGSNGKGLRGGKGGSHGVGVLHFVPGKHGAPLDRWAWSEDRNISVEVSSCTKSSCSGKPVGAVASCTFTSTSAKSSAMVSHDNTYTTSNPTNLLNVLLPNLDSDSNAAPKEALSLSMPYHAPTSMKCARSMTAMSSPATQFQDQFEGIEVNQCAQDSRPLPPLPQHWNSRMATPPQGSCIPWPRGGFPPSPGSLPPPSALLFGRGGRGMGGRGSG